jgi:hypothetical protein
VELEHQNRSHQNRFPSGSGNISVHQVRQAKPDFSIDMKSNQHGK